MVVLCRLAMRLLVTLFSVHCLKLNSSPVPGKIIDHGLNAPEDRQDRLASRSERVYQIKLGVGPGITSQAEGGFFREVSAARAARGASIMKYI